MERLPKQPQTEGYKLSDSTLETKQQQEYLTLLNLLFVFWFILQFSVMRKNSNSL